MTEPRLSVVPQPDACVGAITGLVLRCAEGEREALGILLDLFYASVLAAVAPQGRGGTSDDQVDETFREIWRQAPRFEVGQDPVGWILGLARDLSPGAPVPAAS